MKEAVIAMFTSHGWVAAIVFTLISVAVVVLVWRNKRVAIPLLLITAAMIIKLVESAGYDRKSREIDKRDRRFRDDYDKRKSDISKLDEPDLDRRNDPWLRD